MRFTSADFRRVARNALAGNWKTAVLVGFLASLLGGAITSSGSSFSVGNNSSGYNTPEHLQYSELASVIFTLCASIAALLVIYSLVSLIIGGAVKFGYAKFNLNLIDRKPAVVSDLFSQFNRMGQGFCMNLLMGIYTFLWTLLFIIPGIVKSYSYAMTPYILAEHPELTVNQAITESRRIMQGNKGRLFCLRLSFIGWVLLLLVPVFVLMPLTITGMAGAVIYLVLSIVAVIVGLLFLNPYVEAANAAFYREITCGPEFATEKTAPDFDTQL